jgi:hypothetical protein
MSVIGCLFLLSAVSAVCVYVESHGESAHKCHQNCSHSRLPGKRMKLYKKGLKNKSVIGYETKCKLNSVTLVHEGTIPIQLPPLVGEVSANFCRQDVTWLAQWIPTAIFLAL